jgi:hypothetical protein
VLQVGSISSARQIHIDIITLKSGWASRLPITILVLVFTVEDVACSAMRKDLHIGIHIFLSYVLPR